jgi:hypothetical protein
MKLAGALVLVLALAAVPAAIGARSTVEPEIETEDFSFRPARKVVARGALVVWKEPRPRPAQRELTRTTGRRKAPCSARGLSASAAR